MKESSKKKIVNILLLLLVVSAFFQCLVLGLISMNKRTQKEQNAYRYGQSMADSIRLTLDNAVAASNALEYFYKIYGEDCFAYFDTIASNVAADNSVISSMYIAPDAILAVAYPVEVNESTIGFEMLKDPIQGPKAQYAIDTKKTTIAGPHDLIEGGKGLIIRNPFFRGDDFVGFTIVVLDWDMFMNQAKENMSATTEEYNFGIFKDDVDDTAVDDEEGYIYRSTSESISKKVDIELHVPNDTWHLVVEPVEGWTVLGDMVIEIFISLFINAVLVVLVLVIYSDRERKRQLKKEVLENEAKTVFLSNMSHDIRTPMNAILGFARLMEKKKDDPYAVGDYLKKIQESGEYLLAIINNVLDMSRIESGKIDLDLDVMDVGNEGSTISNLFMEDIQKKNLEFTKEMDVTHRYVMADEARMSQILVNLLSNAIKYTPDGGTIHLSTHEVPCTKEGYATYVTSVADNGIGMSSDFQEHIFESFTREHSTTESKIIGTGLGMAIVKKLVTLMGGEIDVHSVLGKGSTFTVTLTLKIAENPEEYISKNCGEENTQSDLKGKRILLAEDNDLNAEIAIALLEEQGILVDRAVDGVECINMLNKKSAGYYDMILMDIQMPNMNGYDATRRIREIKNEKANIPIVAMTANAFEEDKKNAMEAGMNGHLAKPVNVQKLFDTINAILNE